MYKNMNIYFILQSMISQVHYLLNKIIKILINIQFSRGKLSIFMIKYHESLRETFFIVQYK